MYLSRLLLDLRSRDVLRDLNDCQNLHRTVMSGFPESGSASARAELKILFRLDLGPSTGHPPVLLIQSAVPPDWTTLPDGYLTRPSAARANPVFREVPTAWYERAQGTRLRFRLRANPTKRISDRGPDPAPPGAGKRVELWRESDQLSWLERKGQQHGFTLCRAAGATDPRVANVSISGDAKAFGHRGQSHQRMTFGSVTYDGMLQVADPKLFEEALVHGIGSGKAYGNGLLTIA